MADKKRKNLINDIEKPDDETALTEEQKIDKFYALIRGMREARDRLIMVNRSNNKAKTKDDDGHHLLHHDQLKYVSNKRKKVEEEKEDHNSFQCEDFINTKGEVLFKVPDNSVKFGIPSSSSSSSSSSVLIGADRDKEEDHQKISTKDGLDLTLSL